ncbi:MAG: enoyl-CoA hydratase/isomerase family protein [Rhodospirillales bacterium]
MKEEAEILFGRQGAIATVTLNRPKALNSLTYEMLQRLGEKLDAWKADPDVAAVVIEGAGEKSFCAGGDIRALYDAKQAGNFGYLAEFYRDEYVINHAIATYPKPYIALIDGYTMGGGAGVSVHGSHRVATERTRFAMPEVGIGLFPDVGGSYFLSRCPGQTGLFLGLTGAIVTAADAIHAGIATGHVASPSLEDLKTALASASWTGGEGDRDIASAVIDGFATAPDPAGSVIEANRMVIDDCFMGDSIEHIVDALAADGGEWAAATIDQMMSKSPTSLKVALKEIRRGRSLDLAGCMVMEYRLSQSFMRGRDFWEGVRAVIVDKDKNPKWSPAFIGDVDDQEVANYFESLGDADLKL